MANTAGTSNAARDAANTARETVRDVKDGVQETVNEAGNAAAAGARTIESDLASLRADLARLSEQMTDLIGGRGGAAWEKAKSSFEDVLSEAESKGYEAVDAVREVGDNVVEAIDESLKRRPYTTLVLAMGLGFLFGATWRR